MIDPFDGSTSSGPTDVRRQPSQPASASGAPESPVLVLGLLLKHSRLVLRAFVGGLVLAAVVSVVQGPVFIAESSFRAQSHSEREARLSGIAAQLGFGLPLLSEDPLHFYARLVRSRSVLEGVAQSEFEIVEEGRDSVVRRGNLLDLLEIEGRTREERLAPAVALLDEMIAIETHLDAGMIWVRVKSEHPGLAEQINRRILDLVNEFNVEHRQSQAKAEREFVESRYAEAGRELMAAEEELAQFLERNRSYSSSPHLSFEASRLQRQVDLRQQVYASLAQAYEQARIAEVRNTPLVTVVDRPEGSAKQESHLLRNLIIGIGLAAMTILFGIAGSEYVARLQRVAPAEYRMLREGLDRFRGVVRRRHR